jgi:hypothetical protein
VRMRAFTPSARARSERVALPDHAEHLDQSVPQETVDGAAMSAIRSGLR